MKLYFSKGACSLASRIVINEIGATCEYESVDLKSKKTQSGADFLKINPKGAVPALALDNGSILTENAVIQQYLADTFNAEKLLPSIGNPARYQVLEWLNFIASDLHKGIGILFTPNLTQEMKDQILNPAINKKVSYVDKNLQNKKFLVGNHFTLPDAYLFVMVSWLRLFKFDFKEWKNLDSYYHGLLQHPAVEKSLEEEGLKLSVA